uniref:Genome polyprotein n=1 Tax=Leptinotarsa iflavirus 1 TaxID=3079816 RepID=A0AA96Q035_9VIRU|nr:MAG: polyprotein [Leptinotarsa iflavirus 1]
MNSLTKTPSNSLEYLSADEYFDDDYYPTLDFHYGYDENHRQLMVFRPTPPSLFFQPEPMQVDEDEIFLPLVADPDDYLPAHPHDDDFAPRGIELENIRFVEEDGYFEDDYVSSPPIPNLPLDDSMVFVRDYELFSNTNLDIQRRMASRFLFYLAAQDWHEYQFSDVTHYQADFNTHDAFTYVLSPLFHHEYRTHRYRTRHNSQRFIETLHLTEIGTGVIYNVGANEDHNYSSQITSVRDEHKHRVLICLSSNLLFNGYPLTVFTSTNFGDQPHITSVFYAIPHTPPPTPPPSPPSSDHSDYAEYDPDYPSDTSTPPNEPSGGSIELYPQNSLDPTTNDDAGAAVEVESTPNVDLIENRGAQLASPMATTITPVPHIGSQLVPQTFPELTSRYNNIGTVSWSTNQVSGTLISRLDLPRAALQALSSNPATLPLLQYTFFTPNLTLRFQLNSTPFHSGLIVIGTQYYSALDSGAEGVRVPKSQQQIWPLDSATLNASISNAVELSIPFQSYLDMLPIRDGDAGSSQYYCSVFVYVVSPLRIGTGGSNTVSITQQVKLESDGMPTQFYGQQTRTTVFAQSLTGMLMGELVKAGSSLVSSVIRPVEDLFTGLGRQYPASNMDRPLVPIEQTPIIVYPTGALSSGDGPFQGRSFRLNPATTTPHTPSVPTNGTLLDFHQISSIKGFVSMFSISTTTAVNDLIFSHPISPMIASSLDQDSAVLTPMSGCANMYTYWSGSIKFTFIICKSAPQSLRLRFSISPNNLTTGPEMVDLMSTVQDFEEITTIDYIAPYMAPSPILPVFYDGKPGSAGYIQVRLESQFISPNTSSSTIDVVVLASAGPDFNLSVPRNLALYPISPDIPISPGGATYENLLYQPLWQNRFQIDMNAAIKPGYAYNSILGANIFPVGESFRQNWDYIYVFSASNFVGLHFSNLKLINGATIDAPKQAYVMIPYNKTVNKQPAVDLYFNNVLQTPGITCDCRIDWRGEKPYDAAYFYIIPKPSYPNGVLITLKYKIVTLALEPQNFKTETVNEQGPSTSSSASSSAVLMGEEYPLRTSLRRFQSFLVTQPDLRSSDNPLLENVFAFPIPLNYGHHSIRKAIDPINNLTFCHDAFRFGKGSLRFNIILDSNRYLPSWFKLTAYHVPPGILSNVITTPSWQRISEAEVAKMSMFSHEIVFNNSTSIPFEIPYVNFTRCLVNGFDPRSKGNISTAAFSFGNLVLVCTLEKDFIPGARPPSFRIDIQRALGDDADLYVFQGWPVVFTPAFTYHNFNSSTPLSPQNASVPMIPQDCPHPSTFGSPSEFSRQRTIASLSPIEEIEESEKVVDPVGQNADFLASMIQSLASSRRGRKALRKFLRAHNVNSFLAQDSTPASLKADAVLLQLANAYINFTAIPSNIFLSLDVEKLDPSIIANLTDTNNFDSKIAFQLAVSSLVARIYHLYPGCNYDFYAATGAFLNTSLFHDVKIFMSRASATIPDQIKTKIQSLDDSLKNIPSTLCSILTHAIKGVANIITSPQTLFSFVTSVQMLMCASDTWVRAMALCSLFFQFGILSSAAGVGIAFIVCELLYMAQPVRHGYITLTAQNSEDKDLRETTSRYVAAIMGGVAATAGLAGARSWPEGVATFTRLMSSTSNSWFTLLNSTCSFVVDYVLYLLGHDSPEVLAIAELKAANIDGEEWMKRCLWLIDPSRRDDVLNDASLRKEVAQRYDEGCVIVRSLNVSDPSSHSKLPIVLSVWRSLVTLYSETGEVPDSIKSNRTPICIWLSGAPGIGKSEAAKTLAIKLATLLDISFVGDPFFVRRPRPFWDGYKGQPIIILDDALQVTSDQAMSTFVDDWFGIMTPTPFSPEFSKISEKCKFVTPEIVICTANSAFPEPTNVISDLQAFHRRRDFLFEVIFSPDLVSQDIFSPQDIRVSIETLKSFDHLRFCQYPSSTNRVTKYDPKTKARTGIETETIKPNAPQKLDETLKSMLPHLLHLRNLRLESAKAQIALSDSLNPTVIAKTRDALIESLDAKDLIADAAKTVMSSVAGSVNPQNDPSENSLTIHSKFISPNNPTSMKYNAEKPYVHSLWAEVNGICTYNCMTLPIRCFSLLTDPYFQENKAMVRLCDGCQNLVLMQKGTRRSAGSLMASQQWYPVLRFGESRFSNKALIDDGFDLAVASYNEHVAKLPGPKGLFRFLKPRKVLEPPTNTLPPVDVGDFWTWFNAKNSSFWSFAKKNWKYISILALSIGLMFLFKSFNVIQNLSNFFNVNKETTTPKISEDVLQPLANPQMATSGSPARPMHARRVLKLAQQGNTNDLVPRVNRNLVNITVYHQDGQMSTTWGLGLWERFIVAPMHTFISKSSDVDKIDFTLSSGSGLAGSVLLDAMDVSVTRINGTDLALLHVVNRRIPCFRNLVKTLVPKNRLDVVSNKGILVNVLSCGKDSVPSIHHLDIEFVEMLGHYTLETGVSQFNLLGYSYPMEGNGMCGSVLIDSRSGMIIGMHTAGANGKGYASILSSEFFASFDTSRDVEEPNLPAGGSVKPKGDFIPIGMIPNNLQVNLPLKTQIAKSDCFKVLADPARSPVKMIEPGEQIPGVTNLTLAVEKGGKPTRSWPLKDIDEVCGFLQEEILAYCRPITAIVQTRTVEEAIVGVPGLPFAEALKRSTSVGWPLATLGIGSQKRHFVEYNDSVDGLQVVGIHPKAAEIYNLNRSQRKMNTIPFSPYMNFLKDERLKPGKRPRLINGCPLDQVIEFRRYMMDFCSAVQHSGAKIGVMIGINVHGPEWSTFANRLLSMGDSFICGDYSGFGPGLDPELVLRCGEIVNAWYSEYSDDTVENRTVRMTLFENLAYSHEVSKDTLIQTLCGSPSGNPYTALINSLVNLMYLMLAWKHLFQGTTLSHVSNFRKFIQVGVYGDDLIATVDPSILQIFNNQSLQACFADKGIKYTDADKSGDVRKFCSLQEASFLKCSFIPHPIRGSGFFLAALEKPMIEDIPNWISSDAPDRTAASLANSVQACHLAYAWGFEYFDEIVSKLRTYWRNRGHTMDVCSWDYLDKLYFGELKGLSLPKLKDPTYYAWV